MLYFVLGLNLIFGILGAVQGLPISVVFFATAICVFTEIR